MDRETIFVHEPCTCVLPMDIPAIELIKPGENASRTPPVLNLPHGTRVEICGFGFNERTTKVRCDEKYYYVFSQDLQRN